MNFLRRRLFVAYGMLLVLLGGFAGSSVGGMLAPSKHPPIDEGAFSSSSLAVGIATGLLIIFLIYLHTRARDEAVLDQPPRQWIIFSYGAYAIGLALGIVTSYALR